MRGPGGVTRASTRAASCAAVAAAGPRGGIGVTCPADGGGLWARSDLVAVLAGGLASGAGESVSEAGLLASVTPVTREAPAGAGVDCAETGGGEAIAPGVDVAARGGPPAVLAVSSGPLEGAAGLPIAGSRPGGRGGSDGASRAAAAVRGAFTGSGGAGLTGVVAAVSGAAAVAGPAWRGRAGAGEGALAVALGVTASRGGLAIIAGRRSAGAEAARCPPVPGEDVRYHPRIPAFASSAAPTTHGHTRRFAPVGWPAMRPSFGPLACSRSCSAFLSASRMNDTAISRTR
jgi:hypothetical protein